MRKLVMRTGGDWRVGSVLWLASPFVVSTVLMQGQNDLYPAVLTLAALLLYRRQSNLWVMALLGVAAGFKSYTLILIPVTALMLSQRSIVSAAKLTIAGLIPVALIFGPFVGHEFIVRVFQAHDSGSLLAGFHILKRQVFFWPVAYVSILALAWVVGKEAVDTTKLAAMWLVTLLSIFVFSWWLPQWGVWLLPMAVLLAVRDRLFVWLWLAANALVLAANFLILPGNMDGAMLFPLFGEHLHPIYGHIYLIRRALGDSAAQHIQDLLYTLCMVAFAALLLRTLQWIFQSRSIPSSVLDSRSWIGSTRALRDSLIAPAIMVAVVVVMVAQNLIPPPQKHHHGATSAAPFSTLSRGPTTRV
jgi:hypothetical protein